MRTGQNALLIGGRPHDIVPFLEKILCHEKQEAEFGLSIQCRIRVQDNGKYHIIANLDQRFIVRDWFPPTYPMRLYGDNKAAIHIAENYCHIVHKKIEEKIIVVKHVSIGHQLTDLLTKPPGKPRV